MRYLSLLLLLFTIWVHAAVTPQQRFIGRLLPAITAVNQQLFEQRKQLTDLNKAWQHNSQLTTKQLSQLNELKQRFAVKSTTPIEKVWPILLNRVDAIPTSLVIAQAINESAWGQSRFAKQGNNYFGQWCYTKGCGLVPRQRAKGAHHEVKRFASLQQSIASYLHNLNTHPAYAKLRSLRAQLRAQHKALDSRMLLTALSGYSELGKAYITRIDKLMTRYRLAKYDV